MDDPMERFRAVFFEEGAEAIDAIENNLLGIGQEEADSETINDIFRAAHSLKGGSATFGMTSLTEFTHVMETLLDRVRAGKQSLSQSIVDCLFSSLDVLRNLVSHYQFNDAINEDEMNSVRQQLEMLLEGDGATKAPASPGAAQVGQSQASVGSSPSESAGAQVWTIKFVPHANIMAHGNDPLKFIEELGDYGKTTVECFVDKVPSFYELAPTDMHFYWTITLHTETPVNEQDISDVFMWVEDECELEISCQQQAAPEPTSTSAVESPAAPVAKPAQAKPAANADAKSNANAKQQRGSQSIRVDLDKIDNLINLLGELVITQSMLSVFEDTEKFPQLERLSQGLVQLERHTRDLQEGVMRIRMLPISFCFSRFPRMVRDFSKQLNKDLAVEIVGENTEVDKTVIEELTDPLVHLVRNSVDHGIEKPEDRVAAGKPSTGTISLRASHQVGNIVIEIADDGAGLNTNKIREKAISSGVISEDDMLTEQEIHELIFAPGFSTADAVTDLSGRGVGMDVVKRNIQSLGGTVDVRSTRGEGSVFTIRLPLTLAILDGQLVKVANETYIIPLLSIIESLQISPSEINQVGSRRVTFKWRGSYIPIIDLREAFGCQAREDNSKNGLIVVVESDSQHFGIYVDELTSQQQVVVKSLEANYAKVDQLSGATILGDGSVALIIDVASLFNRLRTH